MGNKWEKIGFVVLLMAILLVGWLGWYLFVYANHWRILAFVALATLIFTIVTYRIDKKNERDDKNREHKEWILRNKEAFLIEIIDIIIEASNDETDDDEVSDDMVKRVKLLHPAFFAHGKKDFLDAWYNFQIAPKDDSSKTFIESERLLRAIRKELGHDDSKIPPGHILMSIIKIGEREELLEHFKDVKYD